MSELGDALRKNLADTFALYLKTHFFHWNVEGPDFVQYHTFLGDFYTAVWNQTDLIAEKIRMLGSYAPSNLISKLLGKP